MISSHKYAMYTGLLCTLLLLGTMIYDMSRPGLFSLGVFNEIKIILCITGIPFCFFIFSGNWNRKAAAGTIADTHWLLFVLGILTMFGATVGIIDTWNESFTPKETNWMDTLFSSKPKEPGARAWTHLIIFSLGFIATAGMLVSMIMFKRTFTKP